MILAGDIGGTKTLLGLFEPGARPRPVSVNSFPTLDYPDLPAIITEFVKKSAAKEPSIASACFGVAGPALREGATLTNVPWKVDARNVRARFKFNRIELLNDLQAMAYSIP